MYPDRVYVTPYIMNNVLWHCVAQIGDEFKIGAYSLFDKEKKVQLITDVDQSADLLGDLISQRDVKILKWFSNGYYAVIKRNDELYLVIYDMEMEKETIKFPQILFYFQLEHG